MFRGACSNMFSQERRADTVLPGKEVQCQPVLVASGNLHGCGLRAAGLQGWSFCQRIGVESSPGVAAAGKRGTPMGTGAQLCASQTPTGPDGKGAPPDGLSFGKPSAPREASVLPGRGPLSPLCTPPPPSPEVGMVPWGVRSCSDLGRPGGTGPHVGEPLESSEPLLRHL